MFRPALILLLAFALGGVAHRAEATQDSRSTSADFLYELGLEYRRSGLLQDAAHELRKALLVDPAHARAARELAEIQVLLQEDRERTMSQALTEAEGHLARAASKRAIGQVVAGQQQRQLSRLLSESASQPPPSRPPAPSPWPARRSLPELPSLAASCATFTFDASGSSDPDHDELSFRWDFGDGTRADGIWVRHTYAAAGEYRVVLEVSDGNCPGCGCARTERKVRANLPPTARLEAPAAACAGDQVRFSALRSNDSPGEPLRYRWDFGDGTTAEGTEVAHAFTRGGDFQVRLTVDDGLGTACSTDATAATLHVNSPPAAKADPEAATCAVDAFEPLSVILSAIGSSDPDFDPLTYRWDFGDGAAGEGVWVSHAYARGGRYTATLTVDDGAGTACSTATASVAVRVNRAPRAELAAPVRSCPGDPVAFDATRSSDPDGDPLAFRWDFGDRAAGKGAAATHRYAAPGLFPVTVTVDDGSGMACATATASAMAAVNAPPVPQLTIRGDAASPLP